MTDAAALSKYFSRFGVILSSRIINNLRSGLSSGCGVVDFKDESDLLKCLAVDHVVDGVAVVAWRPFPTSASAKPYPSGAPLPTSSSTTSNAAPGKPRKVKKITPPLPLTLAPGIKMYFPVQVMERSRVVILRAQYEQTAYSMNL